MTRSVHVGTRSRDTAQVEERAARAATGFAAAGVRAGDAVALLLRNDFAFLEAGAGAACLGAYAVPLNWHLAASEIDYVVHDCDAKVLVVHEDLLPLVDVPGLLVEGRTVLVVPTDPQIRRAYKLPEGALDLPPGATPWDQWLARHEPWRGVPGTPVESVIYTSGTTGRPKGVKRLPATPEQMKRIEAMRATVYGLVPGIRLIVPAPMYHAAPNVFASRGLKVADRLVLMEKFDAEELLRLPEAVRQRYDLSSLQQVYHAAAPCPPEVKADMIAWWGPIINEWYGTTESSVVTWCNSEQWLSHRGTVGRPIDGARVEIVGEDGALLPPGEPGEIYVGLDFYPDFTFHKREDERRQIGRNGLITGGDVGYLDQDGFLYICDRKRDMIISGGVNIYPAEIEAAILASTEVQDCAVFGVPDPEYGEAVLALVVRAPGVPEAGFEQRLRARLEQRLARYKIPRTIETRDALPRHDAGKLIKRRLRDPYWQGIERRI